MHICIHLYVIRDICKSLLIIKVNQWSRRTVRKYEVGRNGKTIIKRLYKNINVQVFGFPLEYIVILYVFKYN